MTSSLPLSGKKALITGGSRGIGAATAKRLAAMGVQVAITYSNSKPQADAVVAEITKAGGNAVALHGDMRKRKEMDALAQHVLAALGGIDILVNNAGQWQDGTIGQYDMEAFHELMHVNVVSLVALTNALVPHMKSGGRIVNISSCLGERAAGANMSGYVGSKFAVSGLTRGWAKDLGAQGILVNAVLPGPIDTEMNPAHSDYSEWQRSQTALGRYGTAEEIAGAVAFLAGPDATYITGALLSVDGGWNA